MIEEGSDVVLIMVKLIPTLHNLIWSTFHVNWHKLSPNMRTGEVILSIDQDKKKLHWATYGKLFNWIGTYNDHILLSVD